MTDALSSEEIKRLVEATNTIIIVMVFGGLRPGMTKIGLLGYRN